MAIHYTKESPTTEVNAISFFSSPGNLLFCFVLFSYWVQRLRAYLLSSGLPSAASMMRRVGSCSNDAHVRICDRKQNKSTIYLLWRNESYETLFFSSTMDPMNHHTSFKNRLQNKVQFEGFTFTRIMAHNIFYGNYA